MIVYPYCLPSAISGARTSAVGLVLSTTTDCPPATPLDQLRLPPRRMRVVAQQVHADVRVAIREALAIEGRLACRLQADQQDQFRCHTVSFRQTLLRRVNQP